jgi:hypothetical protein
LFREYFHHAWTIAALPFDNGPALLLAVDEHQWMVGADRIARDGLGLEDDRLASGVPPVGGFRIRPFALSPDGDKDIAARVMRPAAEDRGMRCLRRP